MVSAVGIREFSFHIRNPPPWGDPLLKNRDSKCPNLPTFLFRGWGWGREVNLEHWNYSKCPNLQTFHCLGGGGWLAGKGEFSWKFWTQIYCAANLQLHHSILWRLITICLVYACRVYYLPSMELREGNIFSHVYPSFCIQGGHYYDELDLTVQPPPPHPYCPNPSPPPPPPPAMPVPNLALIDVKPHCPDSKDM